MQTPRPEHPRPQLRRDAWLSLNGSWDFDFDFSLSGRERGWQQAPELTQRITVPFCPESRLSGIAHTDFIPAVWYRRSLEIPPDWRSGQVRLHFGAVDYECRAWVNGVAVGRHLGGSSSFHFDITRALTAQNNELVVEARDDTRSGLQPGGKQSHRLHSHGCHYTRTTGIWQTVWLEAVPAARIEDVRIVADLDGSRFVLNPVFANARQGTRFRATLLTSIDSDDIVRQVEAPALSGAALSVKLDTPRPWSPADPHLYGLRFELLDASDAVLDTIHSYAGLRKFHLEGHRFFLNNEPIFLRFVLDQGFYPEGIWTAPADRDLHNDIRLSQAAGFNGARLHQKVFEERFHYWADRLGYLTWGEFSDWGLDFGHPGALHNHQREWQEVVLRDRNHPSIVTWTPFNETAGGARAHTEAHHQALRETYELTRALDPNRPCHDTSGYVHVVTDVFTVHDYEQDPQAFAARYANVDPSAPDAAYVSQEEHSIGWDGERPYVVDEYGGTWWVDGSRDEGTDRDAGWGYGNRPASIEEVYQRIEGLTAVLLAQPHIAGYCYTQLTDIEQEQNGIYTYDRRPKFDGQRLRAAFAATAAIEDESQQGT
jgi:beta-galactosidase/beta-glucuronidase